MSLQSQTHELLMCLPISILRYFLSFLDNFFQDALVLKPMLVSLRQSIKHTQFWFSMQFLLKLCHTLTVILVFKSKALDDPIRAFVSIFIRDIRDSTFRWSGRRQSSTLGCDSLGFAAFTSCTTCSVNDKRNIQ